MSNVYDIFSGEQLDVSRDERSIGFMEEMAADITGELLRLGLAGEHVAISARHIQDIRPVVTQNGSTQPTNLTLQPSGSGTYERLAIINNKELRTSIAEVGMQLKKLRVPATKEQLGVVGLKWLISRLCMDAVSNSVYMQNTFDKYIPDFHGQSPVYQTETTIARQFLSAYADGETVTPELVHRETVSLRGSFGLHMLGQFMLRDCEIAQLKTAEWAVNGVSERIGESGSLIEGMYGGIGRIDEYGIGLRLQAAEVKDPHPEYLQLAFVVQDVDLSDE